MEVPKKKKKHAEQSTVWTIEKCPKKQSHNIDKFNDSVLEKNNLEYISVDNCLKNEYFAAVIPKKKKIHKKLSYIESTADNDTEEIIAKNNGECIENMNENYFNEALTKKKKSKKIHLAGVKLDNNDKYEVLTPKKKKKHDIISFIENTTDCNTEEELNKTTNESVNKQNGFKKKYLADVKLDNNDIHNILTPKKKKKKHGISSSLLENTTDCNTEEELNKTTNENVNKQNGSKKKYLADIKLDNNDIYEIVTPKKKKKKKHDISSILLENSTDCNTEEEINKTIKTESVENINYDGNYESVNKQNKSKKNSADVKLDNNEKYEIFTPKKKKKHDISSSLLENTIDCNNEEKLNKTTNESINKQNGSKINYLADVTLDNNDKNEILTPKKKKKNKHDISSSLLENTTNCNTNEEINRTVKSKSVENINDDNLNESVTKINKSKNNHLAEVTLDTFDKYETASPKKKTKHDIRLSSVEITTYNNSETIKVKSREEKVANISDNDSDFNKTLLINKKNILSENNDFSSVTLDNDGINNDQFDIITPPPKKKHDTKLKSVESTSDYDNKGEINKKNKTKSVKNTSSGESNNSLIKNRERYMYEQYVAFDIETANSSKNIGNINLLLQEFTKDDNNINESFDENSCHETIKHEYSTFDFNIAQEFENMSDFNDFKDKNITTETELDSKKLIIDIMETKSSIINHSHYESILSMLSRNIRTLLNKKCKMVSSYNMNLLKAIGEKILEKIVEKQNSSESIEGLQINVPSESKKNKIHYIETQLSKPPDKEKMNAIRQLNPSVKFGVFNEEEDDLIRKYWSKFQKEYNITDIQPFLSNGLEMGLPYEERLQFFRYLSAGLPNRLLYSVFYRFNVLYNKLANQLSFTEEEDKIILQVDKCDAIKNKYAVLSFILNRTRLQLYRRLNTLKRERSDRIIWDDCRRQELFEHILKETNTKYWRDLKNMKIKKKTWIKIAENFSEPINYEKAKNQWNFISTMLFCERSIKYAEFKLRILELLLQIKPKHWSDLNWVEITNEFYPGASSKVIVTVFHWWIYHKVPKDIRNNVRDTIKYLSTNYVGSLASKVESDSQGSFPRLKVDNDNLLVKIE